MQRAKKVNEPKTDINLSKVSFSEQIILTTLNASLFWQFFKLSGKTWAHIK